MTLHRHVVAMVLSMAALGHSTPAPAVQEVVQHVIVPLKPGGVWATCRKAFPGVLIFRARKVGKNKVRCTIPVELL